MATTAAALAAVAPLETGVVINDAYTYQHYLARRVHFLSQHDEYSQNMDLFPITRRDADFIFTSECETLSVQEIRRRELDIGLEVLLPLPTTNNMATLSNYSLYPEEEYNPDYEHLPGGPSLPTSRANSVSAEENGMSGKRVDVSTSESRVDTPFYESPADRERREFYERQGLAVPARKQQPSPPKMTPQFMASILSHLETYDPTETAGPATNEEDAPVAEDDETLPAESVKEDTSMEDAVAQGEAVSRNSTTPPLPVSTKSTGITKPKKSIARPVPKKSSAITKPPPPLTKRRNHKALAVKIPKLSTESPEFSPLTGNPLSPIIAGDTLPTTPAQALEAQTALLTRLQTANPKAKSFPPEFHSIPTTKKTRRKSQKRNEEEEGEFIACICGSRKEPKKGDWIACDECDVWQHDGCMGKGVPDDKEGGRYLCQVCDPWVHRELLAGLRARESN